MEYISLYRRFRPDTFDKVIGQDHIVRTLTNQIKNGRIGHAYLFTGTRGTGKTSCAKIFARAVNCLRPVNGSPCGECEVCKALQNPANIDIAEIDAASNNGVDEIRELKEKARYAPVSCRYKVYIIDEVHMLSTAAFNALLKTLEEPPEHIIFILATTEVQKLPQTILSRCMRFDFRLVEKPLLVALLKRIFAELGVPAEDKALNVIASGGEGSVRDTLSLADMCLSYGGDRVTYKDALEVLCATNFDTLHELGCAVLDGDVGKTMLLADGLLKAGRNTLGKDLARYFTDFLNLKNVANTLPDGMTEEDAEKIRARADDFSNYRIARAMDILCSVESAARYSTQPKTLLEAALVKACELTTETDNTGLANRLKELEKKVSENKNVVYVSREAVLSEPKVEVSHKETQKEVPQEENLEEMLSRMADAEVETVFEERKADDKEQFYASEIWSKVVTSVAGGEEAILKMAVEGVEKGMKIEGNKFILETEDAPTFHLLNRAEYRKIIQDVIRVVTGKDYEFVCTRKVSSDVVSDEDKLTLDRLFSGEVKFKSKK